MIPSIRGDEECLVNSRRYLGRRSIRVGPSVCCKNWTGPGTREHMAIALSVEDLKTLADNHHARPAVLVVHLWVVHLYAQPHKPMA